MVIFFSVQISFLIFIYLFFYLIFIIFLFTFVGEATWKDWEVSGTGCMI